MKPISFEEQIKALGDTANKFVPANQTPPIETEAYDNLSFSEAATRLRGNGFFQHEDSNDIDFVLGYALSSPTGDMIASAKDLAESERLLDLEYLGLDATKDIPLYIRTMLPETSKHYWNAGAMKQLKYDYLGPIANTFTTLPTLGWETLRSAYEGIDEIVSTPFNLDYSQLGDGFTDLILGRQGGIDKISLAFSKASDSKKKDRVALGGKRGKQARDVTSDFFASYINKKLDEEKNNPELQAHQQRMSRLHEMELGEMDNREMVSYVANAVGSGFSTIASGAVVGGGTFAATKNPVKAGKAAVTAMTAAAFALESTSEFKESFQYFKTQGFSNKDASERAHFTSLVYGTVSAYIEKFALNKYVPAKWVDRWGGEKKLLKRFIGEKAAKLPNNKITRAAVGLPKIVKDIVILPSVEFATEGAQRIAQGLVQSSYKDVDYEEVFGEAKKEARAGAVSSLFIKAGVSGGVDIVNSIADMYDFQQKNIYKQSMEDSKIEDDANIQDAEFKDIVKAKVSFSALTIQKFMDPTESSIDKNLSPELLDSLESIDFFKQGGHISILDALQNGGVDAIKEAGYKVEDVVSEINSMYSDSVTGIKELINLRLQMSKPDTETAVTKAPVKTPVIEPTPDVNPLSVLGNVVTADDFSESSETTDVSEPKPTVEQSKPVSSEESPLSVLGQVVTAADFIEDTPTEVITAETHSPIGPIGIRTRGTADTDAKAMNMEEAKAADRTIENLILQGIRNGDSAQTIIDGVLSLYGFNSNENLTIAEYIRDRVSGKTTTDFRTWRRPPAEVPTDRFSYVDMDGARQYFSETFGGIPNTGIAISEDGIAFMGLVKHASSERDRLVAKYKDKWDESRKQVDSDRADARIIEKYFDELSSEAKEYFESYSPGIEQEYEMESKNPYYYGRHPDDKGIHGSNIYGMDEQLAGLEASTEEAPVEDNYSMAKKLLIDLDSINESVLQRKLKIGFSEAGRIIDRLEQEGKIGPAGPKKMKVAGGVRSTVLNMPKDTIAKIVDLLLEEKAVGMYSPERSDEIRSLLSGLDDEVTEDSYWSSDELTLDLGLSVLFPNQKGRDKAIRFIEDAFITDKEKADADAYSLSEIKTVIEDATEKQKRIRMQEKEIKLMLEMSEEELDAYLAQKKRDNLKVITAAKTDSKITQRIVDKKDIDDVIKDISKKNLESTKKDKYDKYNEDLIQLAKDNGVYDTILEKSDIFKRKPFEYNGKPALVDAIKELKKLIANRISDDVHKYVDMAIVKGDVNIIKNAGIPMNEALSLLENKARGNYVINDGKTKLSGKAKAMAVEQAKKMLIVLKDIQPSAKDSQETLFQRPIEERLGEDIAKELNLILPKIQDAKQDYTTIINKLAKDYPNVVVNVVENLFDDNGIEVAGSAVSNIASWSKSKATIDTAPHEYFHILFNALKKSEDSDIIRLAADALNEFGFDEEALVQKVGELYTEKVLKDANGKANKSLTARFKTWMRKAWNALKNFLNIKSKGKSYAEQLADIFVNAEQSIPTPTGIIVYRDNKPFNIDSNEKNTLTVDGEQSVLIKKLKDNNIPGADNITVLDSGRPADYRIADKFIRSALKNEYKFIKYTNSQMPQKGIEYHDLTDDTFYSDSIMLSKQYSMQRRQRNVSKGRSTVQFQNILPEDESFEKVINLINNAYEEMVQEKRNQGSKLPHPVPLGDFITTVKGSIPDRAIMALNEWSRRKFPNGLYRLIDNTVRAGHGAYTTQESFETAVIDPMEGIREGLSLLDGDVQLQAKNGQVAENIFLSEFGSNMTAAQFSEFMKDALEMEYDNWVNDSLPVHVGRTYKSLDPRGKTLVKKLYVRSHSMVNTNMGSPLEQRNNLIYNKSYNSLQIKGPSNPFTEDTHPNREQKMIYEIANPDINSSLFWLGESDISEVLEEQGDSIESVMGKGKIQKTFSRLSLEEFDVLEASLANFKYPENNINGLVFLFPRSEKGKYAFAAIKQEHLDIASNTKDLKAYWESQSLSKNQKENFFNSDNKAGEIARFESYKELMPVSEISNGPNFFKRISIATTPVFTSPLLKDMSAVHLDFENLTFVDENNVAQPAIYKIRGFKDKKSSSDGAGIIGAKGIRNFSNAFGNDASRKTIKPIIWTSDLSLAAKLELQLAPQLTMYRNYGEQNQLLVGSIDKKGNIVIGDSEVDMILSDDEAKIFSKDSEKVFTIASSEIGLINYSQKHPKARHFLQWYNFVDDQGVIENFNNDVLPEVKKRINRVSLVSKMSNLNRQTILDWLRATRSDAYNAPSNPLVEKNEAALLGQHPDNEPMLDVLLATQEVVPALGTSFSKGMQLHSAPDWTNIVAEGEVQIAWNDAIEVRKAYAKVYNIPENTLNKEADIAELNKWLSKNPYNIIISRSPIANIDGVIPAKITKLHDRAGQIVINTGQGYRSLEFDFDGDTLQANFVSDAFYNSVSNAINKARENGRIQSIDLTKYANSAADFSDLSKKENAYKLTEMFNAGARAIGEISNIQSLHGMMKQSFRGMEVSSEEYGTEYITIKPFDYKEEFVEGGLGEILTIENIIRIWQQAALDNGKFLLLHEWDYSHEKVAKMIFIKSKLENDKLIATGPINDNDWSALKPLVNMYKMPSKIRNGGSFSENFKLSQLKDESEVYHEFVRDRELYYGKYLNEDYGTIESVAKKVYFNTNASLMPLESIAISLSEQWEESAEDGKINFTKFLPEIYQSSHLQSLNKLQDLKIDLVETMAEEYSQEQLLAMGKEGHKYAMDLQNAMVKALTLDYKSDNKSYLPLTDEQNKQISSGIKTQISKPSQLTEGETFQVNNKTYVITNIVEKTLFDIITEDFKLEGYNSSKEMSNALKKLGYNMSNMQRKLFSHTITEFNSSEWNKDFAGYIGPMSWGRNEKLVEMTEIFADRFNKLDEFGQYVATILYLEGIHTVNEKMEIRKGKNRNVLPPFKQGGIGDESNITGSLLHPFVMKEYSDNYNEIISNKEQRSLLPSHFTNYERFSNIIKEICR